MKTEFSGIDRDEFVALATSVGIPGPGELARFLGKDRRLTRQWFAGEVKVPIPEVMVLELMKHYGLTPVQVEDITGEWR